MPHRVGGRESFAGVLVAYLDIAVADDIAHFAAAAIQRLAGLEPHAAAGFAGVHRYRRRRLDDARRLRRALGGPFAVDPDGRWAGRALDEAVYPGDRPGGRDGIVGQPRAAPRVERRALLGGE